MKKYILFLIVFLTTSSYAQKVDSSLVFLKAKIDILSSQNYCLTKSDYIDIMNGNMTYNVLKSEGFIDIFFFEVFVDPISRNDTLSMIFSGPLYRKYYFVFGYNIVNNQIYKLVGFNNNDFELLYKFLFRDYSDSKLINKHNFHKNFSIEHVDLKCMYNNLMRKYKFNKLYKYCVCDDPWS